MTDFLQDPIYLQYMDEESEKSLIRAKAAICDEDFAEAIEKVRDAKKRFSPSEFFKKHEKEFDEIECIAMKHISTD